MSSGLKKSKTPSRVSGTSGVKTKARVDQPSAVNTAPTREIYIHGRTRDFTSDEYLAACNEAIAAHKRGDEEEYIRLTRVLPLDPKVARAAKIAWGRQHLIDIDADLTEANLVWGEGWLDEPED